MKPILFSTPMVQAILAGRKTQTRRVIKFPLNEIHSNYGLLELPKENQKLLADWALSKINNQYFVDQYLTLDYEVQCEVDDSCNGKIKSKYSIGDILWVRESFSIIGTDVIRDEGSGAIIEEHPQYVFRGQKMAHIEKLFKWKPSIFMPREACRLFLEVTNVRIERLNEISEEDAISEGVLTLPNFVEYQREFDNAVANKVRPPLGLSPRERFQKLWESINGEGSWDLNPYVWVYDFKVKEVKK